MTMASQPSRGEVWYVDLNPTRGHEQSGTRPCLIISDDGFNHGLSGLVIVLPITSKRKNIPSNIEIKPPEGGLTMTSYIKCEDIRSISIERLAR